MMSATVLCGRLCICTLTDDSAVVCDCAVIVGLSSIHQFNMYTYLSCRGIYPS